MKIQTKFVNFITKFVNFIPLDSIMHKASSWAIPQSGDS